ncbi:MAG: hypothetical protein K2K27_00740 [Muribaculaceae bacterium]|nr:hypothetical protein [Muribaculaceae bacterium]
MKSLFVKVFHEEALDELSLDSIKGGIDCPCNNGSLICSCLGGELTCSCNEVNDKEEPPVSEN